MPCNIIMMHPLPSRPKGVDCSLKAQRAAEVSGPRPGLIGKCAATIHNHNSTAAAIVVSSCTPLAFTRSDLMLNYGGGCRYEVVIWYVTLSLAIS